MQIVTTAKIEKCEIKKGNTGLKFSGLKLTSRQVEHVSDLVNGEEEVKIIIEATQGQMFDEEKAPTVSPGETKRGGKKKDGKKG